MLSAPPGLPARYRFERLLGKGGQAKTYLATDDETGRPLAVKVFELRDAENWKGFELFERECRVLRSLEHRHVVDYVEHGGDEDRGVFYLVMTYADGPTLEQGVRDGKRYTDGQLETLLRELLITLRYLHSLNPPVVHRDIKPANVVQTADGVKLVDFGGVRNVFSDRANSTVVGTFGYMAPEQLRGEASPASDLYGLGATIAAVASGTDAADLPHAGLEIDLEQCMKPGRIRDVLAAMLRADPRERTSSAAEAIELLEADTDADTPAPHETVAPARSDDLLYEVESLARRGETIAAIRRYRELTGAGLREARSAVNAITPTTSRPGVTLAKLGKEDRLRANLISVAVGTVALLGSGVAGAPVGVAVFIGFAIFSLSRFVTGNVFRGFRSED